MAAAAAYPATSVYRAGRPVLAATFSSSRHGFRPAVQKGRVFAPVLGCWCGLRRLQLSVVGIRSAPPEKKDKCRRMLVYASLFGVGAPEALVIGVVALLVFGPKGLAEVARTLGKTLKAFQPTIRELQEVSRDFKTTLEREIGLDEDITSTRSTATRSSIEKTQEDVNLNGSPSFEEILRASREQLRPSRASTTSDKVEDTEAKAYTSEELLEDTEAKAYTSEELLKVTEEQLAAHVNEQQLANDAKQKETQSAAPEISVRTPAPTPQMPEILSENET